MLTVTAQVVDQSMGKGEGNCTSYGIYIYIYIHDIWDVYHIYICIYIYMYKAMGYSTLRGN